MKTDIFISYSNHDIDKVEIITNQLRHHKTINPIVIAQNREALKPLAKKVSDGIRNSSFFIPIITNQSLTAQWINQEIGYAFALEKKIMPLVEIEAIEMLKGFIHKQIDLPYNFSSLSNGKNTSNFTTAFNTLIKDLVVISSNFKYNTNNVNGETILNRINEGIEFEKKRNLILYSDEGYKAAIDEFDKICFRLKPNSKNNSTGLNKGKSDRSIYSVLQINSKIKLNASLYLKWGNNNKDSFLFLHGEETVSYIFDINKNMELGWRSQNENKFYSTEGLIMKLKTTRER